MLVLYAVLNRKMCCKTQIASTGQETPFPSLYMYSWDVTGTSMEQSLHPHNVRAPLSRQVRALSLCVKALCDLLYCPSNNTEKTFSVLYSIITHCCQFTLIWMTADKNNTKWEARILLLECLQDILTDYDRGRKSLVALMFHSQWTSPGVIPRVSSSTKLLADLFRMAVLISNMSDWSRFWNSIYLTAGLYMISSSLHRKSFPQLRCIPTHKSVEESPGATFNL